VGSRDYDLAAGDSVYFDARIPHAQCAVGTASRFITIIQE
jgi:hypothetical protein